MRRLPQFSLRALLIAFTAVALALAIWVHRTGSVTLRTTHPDHPIEITLDTHRLLALTDLRLPNGSGKSLIWRGDSSWQVIEGVDEARWVNNWSHIEAFNSDSTVDRSFSGGPHWTSMGSSPPLQRYIFFTTGTGFSVRMWLRAKSGMSIGPVYPLRLFLTPELTRVRYWVRSTGGEVSEGGVHSEHRVVQVPGDPGDSYSQRLFLHGRFTLENPETGDGLGFHPYTYPEIEDGSITQSIEWDADRHCPVILWHATEYDIWGGEDNMEPGDSIRAGALFAPQELLLNTGRYVGDDEQVGGDARFIGEDSGTAVWQLPPLMRPYPRLTASPSSREPLTLVAPRGGSDTSTIYLPAASLRSGIEGDGVLFTLPTLPGVEVTLEATRCLDIEWLVDPDGALGLTPEILIPVEEGQALDPAPEGQGFLLTARVSRNATPGVISGEMRLGDLQLPVEIEIVNWEMPERPSLRTAFELYAWNLADRSPENLRRWMEIFAENRIGVALMTPPTVEVTDSGVEIDWTRFDAAARVVIDELGMSTFFTPPGLMGFQADRIDHWGLQHGTRPWEEAWRDYLPQLEAHLDANGWLDKAVFDLWDEPNATTERAAVCEEVGELARMVREHAPRLPQYVSTTEIIPQLEASWPEDLQGAVSMAVLRQAPLEAIESRPRWFTLDSMVRSWITTSLDAPRATPLVAWAFGLEGMEMWSVNAWNDARQREPGRLDPIDTRSLEPLGPLGAADMGGILLYQDSEGRPLRSLTWVALGQGMQDVEILEALRAVEPRRAERIAQEIRDAVRAGERPLGSDWPDLRREMLHLLVE